MSIRVAFQMDHVGGVDIHADSTFRIAVEAQRRAYPLFHYLPADIHYDQGKVCAHANPLTVKLDPEDHYRLGEEATINLADMDVVWLRQDPPFDMAYITTTHLLDLVKEDTLVVNDPFWVRNCPEKLLVLHFPGLIPPTMIARSRVSLKEFRARHGDIVVKPLYGNGGAGVFLLREQDPNFNSLCEVFLDNSREPLIAQKFLPGVSEGDKRIILVDGEAVGAINRIPPPGEARSNLHVGGRAEPCGLTERDREICESVGPFLRQHGQVFAGIDVIGGWLTEINITSPTGIVELERFDGTNAAGLIWDAIERRLASR
ncbi:MAG: glutathione synthase [Rhodobacteraceae bacterium]|nr:glutathione synthase [Paracoccaceae bacterium]